MHGSVKIALAEVDDMISKNSKEEIIQGLLVTKQKAHALEVRLLLKGKQKDGKKVARKSKALSRKIDILLGQVMDEWQGQGNKIIKDIKSANADLQRSIAEIKRNVKTAQNIVKAIGLIDDAIVMAKGFIG